MSDIFGSIGANGAVKRFKNMGDGSYAEVVSAILESSSVTITGPVTVSNEVEVKNDTGNPVPVSGPLTDAQLRASAISVLKGQQAVFNCVISSGQSLSASVDLGVFRVVGISIPATFEATTLTFQSSFDGTTWNNVYDANGVEKSVTVAASRRVIVSPADFFGVRYIKVRGGTSGSPTNAAADRTIKLIAEA